ncbi:unnamed protein product [Parajaminaea phylloscopi]
MFQVANDRSNVRPPSSPDDTQSVLKALQAFTDELQDLSTHPPTSRDTQWLRDLALWESVTRKSRKDSFLDEGMSEPEAERASLEALVSYSTAHALNVFTPQPTFRRYEWHVNDLGTFDGDTLDLRGFLYRISLNHEIATDVYSRELLLKTIPVCLRGRALDWYMTLSDGVRYEQLKTWPAWEQALLDAFDPPPHERLIAARDRHWRYSEETVRDYFFQKHQMLQSSLWTGHTDGDIIEFIKEGVPSSLRMYLRTGLIHREAKLDDLFKEMTNLERAWREDDLPARALSKEKKVQRHAGAAQTPEGPRTPTKHRQTDF